MKPKIILCLALVLSGGLVGCASKWAPAVPHVVSVLVPTGLSVVWHDDALEYNFSSFQTTNLLVAYKMTTGIECDASIYSDGVTYPLFRSGGDAIPFGFATNVYALNHDTVERLRENCVFEYRIIIFQTDLPAQSRWSPQSGKYYKVLWQRTLKQTVE